MLTLHDSDHKTKQLKRNKHPPPHPTHYFTMNLRRELTNVLNLCFIFTGAFMFWKTLGIVANTSSPIVVVLSGSMEPAFYRGDVLFLWNRNQYNNVGDIVVYEIENKQIPIVHRVINEYKQVSSKNSKSKKKDKSQDLNTTQYLLTKGDNNNGHDVPLYGHGKQYLQKDKDIVGTVKGYLPQVGYITIWISENKNNQLIFYGVLGLAALLFN